jgi:hypothetical protein
MFVIFSVIFFTIFFGLLGYAFKRKTGFYKAQVEVDIDANPYVKTKIVPNNVACWEGMVELFEKFNIDPRACTEMKQLLANSGSTKYPMETSDKCLE